MRIQADVGDSNPCTCPSLWRPQTFHHVSNKQGLQPLKPMTASSDSKHITAGRAAPCTTEGRWLVQQAGSCSQDLTSRHALPRNHMLMGPAVPAPTLALVGTDN